MLIRVTVGTVHISPSRVGELRIVTRKLLQTQNTSIQTRDCVQNGVQIFVQRSLFALIKIIEIVNIIGRDGQCCRVGIRCNVWGLYITIDKQKGNIIINPNASNIEVRDKKLFVSSGLTNNGNANAKDVLFSHLSAKIKELDTKELGIINETLHTLSKKENPTPIIDIMEIETAE